MCGVAGILDMKGARPINERALKQMTNALAHRGPDGEGFYTAPGIGLGHRRLIIIDREGGVQPFKTASQGAVLSYNGEIYNYRDLQNDLNATGPSLRTRSDVEVLAEGLEREGHAFIDKLRGMFAFAFWREKSRTLILGRDRLGEKPLYYAETKDGFLLFASELSAIMASGMVDAELCSEAVCDYFHFGYVPDPKSIYRGIKKLPPATVLTVSQGAPPKLQPYWKASFPADNQSTFKETSETLLEKLDEAVALQCIADVPLGAFLSGGVDSSAITASMALQSNGAPITACTVGFDDAAYDERDHARLVARRYDVDHREETASHNMTAAIDQVAQSFGEPFADPSALPTFAVCGLARRHVTVALSGDGADEVFAGYRRYPFFMNEERIRNAAPLPLRRALFGSLGAIWPKLDQAPRPLRWKTTFQSLGENRARAYLRMSGFCLPDHAEMVMSEDLKESLKGYDSAQQRIELLGLNARTSPVAWAQAVDFQNWLPGRMLTKIDRCSMAHSLEVRAPFLDHTLVDWAGQLPIPYKLGAGGGSARTGKRVLKAALEHRLDHATLYRPKQGFGAPVGQWLKNDKTLLQRLDESTAWRDCGLLDTNAIQQMADAHRTGQKNMTQPLWAVIMFDAFLRSASRH